MRRRGRGFKRYKGFSNPDKRGLYRSRDGMLLGVCKGIADYFDLSVFWVRFVFVICFFFGGMFPVVFVYIIAALVMKPEPVMPLYSDSDHEFYDSYVNSRTSAIQRLKRKFDSLNRRIQRLEDCVTSREFNWEERFRR